METKFDRLAQRLHRVGGARLADALGTFQAPGCMPVEGIPLQVLRNVEMTGPNGMLVGLPLALSWPRAQLAGATRGDRFTVKGTAYLVEEVVLDDGYWLTATCMEEP